MQLDKRFPFSTVYGSSTIKYAQGGMNFDQLGKRVPDVIDNSDVIEHADYRSALAFLEQILKGGPLTKSKVFTSSQQNNQSWGQVSTASRDPRFLKFKYGNSEAWKLKDVI